MPLTANKQYGAQTYSRKSASLPICKPLVVSAWTEIDMMKSTLLILTIGIFFTDCSMFDQNDFLSTEYVGQIDNEIFFYSAYKTGIDNYRIEFKVVADKDTSKIFNYFINDALYSKENAFSFSTSRDTLIVSTPFQSCEFYYKTKKGTTISLINKSDTKICDK